MEDRHETVPQLLLPEQPVCRQTGRQVLSRLRAKLRPDLRQVPYARAVGQPVLPGLRLAGTLGPGALPAAPLPAAPGRAGPRYLRLAMGLATPVAIASRDVVDGNGGPVRGNCLSAAHSAGYADARLRLADHPIPVLVCPAEGEGKGTPAGNASGVVRRRKAGSTPGAARMEVVGSWQATGKEAEEGRLAECICSGCYPGRVLTKSKRLPVGRHIDF